MLELLIPGGLVVLALGVILAELRAQRHPPRSEPVRDDEHTTSRLPPAQ